jgi:alpha-N-arabinofuranosidase
MSLSSSNQPEHLHVRAQSSKPAALTIDDHFPVGAVNRRLFGTLVEHLGRCVYGGIYDPASSYADSDGFRTDVMKLVRELGITTVRYPGGNFVSGYRWEDGVGPVDKRPRRLDLAWHSTETNRMGLHEMEKWLHEVNPAHPLELIEAVNLGTRGLESALDLLEYANIPSGTKLSDMRRANGAKDPFNIRMWCLGNEMDGPWQLGHLTASEYASKVRRVAAGMRQIDPNLELVACGSSSHGMNTFGTWEGTVLDQAYDLVNFVSCHAYYQPRVDNGVRDMRSFLASGVDMDGFISDVAACIDAARARAKSSHEVNISFDEWNVWYTNEPGQPHAIDDWPVGPHLLENHYTLADAVVVGDLLITLLRHVDRVRAASIAQLVNVIAPIFVPENGPAYRQTTFFPFARTAELAKGGAVLAPRDSGPTVNTDAYGDVSMVDSVAVRRADGGLAVFAVNRSMDEAADFTINLPTAGTVPTTIHAESLAGDDIDAQNTAENPNRVTLAPNTSVKSDGRKVHVSLPPVSWTVVTVD